MITAVYVFSSLHYCTIFNSRMNYWFNLTPLFFFPPALTEVSSSLQKKVAQELMIGSRILCFDGASEVLTVQSMTGAL